jgi:hypothetical protein
MAESALRKLKKEFEQNSLSNGSAKAVSNLAVDQAPNKAEMLAGIVPRKAIVSPLKR